MPHDAPRVPNWVGGAERRPDGDLWLEKRAPHDDQLLSRFADSSLGDVEAALSAAVGAFRSWSETTPVRRGQILADIAGLMKRHAGELADCVAVETGKPPQDAKGEVNGAILQAEFFAGEGMRLYARSLTSGVQGKFSHTVRQPRGVCGASASAISEIWPRPACSRWSSKG